MGQRVSHFSHRLRFAGIACFLLSLLLLGGENVAAQPQGKRDYELTAKSLKESIEHFDLLINGDQQDASLYLQRANLYLKLYQLDRFLGKRHLTAYAEKTLADFSKAIELNPSEQSFSGRANFHKMLWEQQGISVELAKERAESLLGDTNFKAATEDYLNAIRLSTVSENLAGYFKALSELHGERARRLVEAAKAHNSLARVETRSIWGDYDAAIEYAKKAAEHARDMKPLWVESYNSHVANSYAKKGATAFERGEFDLALDTYQAGEKYIPENYLDVCIYYGMWGSTYSKKHLFVQAIEKFNTALKISEANCAYLIEQRGDTYAAQGDAGKALSDYNTRMKKYADAVKPRGALGLKRARVYLQLGDAEKALADLDYSINTASLDDCPQPYLLRAKAYRQLGKINLALADEQKAATLPRGLCGEN